MQQGGLRSSRRNRRSAGKSNRRCGTASGSGNKSGKIRSSARLMARLHVPEWQSRELQLNQKAQIELQDRPYSGHVARIDPGEQNGAVDVDVKVDGAQPAGVRTDLTVDGTIEVERVADAVYLGKDRKSTRLNSSHGYISYAVFCLKKKKTHIE